MLQKKFNFFKKSIDNEQNVQYNDVVNNMLNKNYTKTLFNILW
nr:MAG TPA: hypothetical protein [Caudoviricetes sp.]